MSIKKFLGIVLWLLFLVLGFQSYSQELDYKVSVTFHRQDTVSATRIPLERIYYNLINCSDTGNYEMVDFLLKRGANPNYSIEGGITPLMLAVDNGHYEVAKLLIEHGADVNAKPSDGNTPIFAAVRNNNDSIVQLLINSNANINVKNAQEVTPLHYACSFGYPYMTSLLIERGAKINEKDLNGNTPVMCSVYTGANSSTDILIDAGADVNIPDNDGNTPLMVAAQFNDTVLIDKLINANADVKIKNNNQKDALTIAIENNSNQAFTRLFELIDNSSKSQYYHPAKENENFEIANYLANNGFTSEYRFILKNINFYTGFSSNSNDFMLDFGFGIHEASSNLILSLGYKHKPYSNRVLEYRENALYQFWEKRYSFYVSIQYPMPFYKLNIKGQLGLIPGYSNELTWRYYRGLEKGSGLKYVPNPSLGLYYKRKNVCLVGKWDFANYYRQINSANRFSLQLLISIPTKKTITKKINWLD